MSQWKKVKIGDFLTERAGRYKPDDPTISKYQRLDKIDFSGAIHISTKPTKTDMILVQPGDLVISGINVAKDAVSVYQGSELLRTARNFVPINESDCKHSDSLFSKGIAVGSKTASARIKSCL